MGKILPKTKQKYPKTLVAKYSKEARYSLKKVKKIKISKQIPSANGHSFFTLNAFFNSLLEKYKGIDNAITLEKSIRKIAI